MYDVEWSLEQQIDHVDKDQDRVSHKAQGLLGPFPQKRPYDWFPRLLVSIRKTANQATRTLDGNLGHRGEDSFHGFLNIPFVFDVVFSCPASIAWEHWAVFSLWFRPKLHDMLVFLFGTQRLPLTLFHAYLDVVWQLLGLQFPLL